jgi:hypothetical protein
MSKASICRTFEVKRSTLIDSLNRANIWIYVLLSVLDIILSDWHGISNTPLINKSLVI